VTTVREEEKEGSATATAPEPEITAHARACPREDTPSAAPLPSKEVTERVRVLREHLGKLAAYLDRPGSLVHAQPPTFARAREQHHEAAGGHNGLLLRGLRLTWGYAHLLIIKPVLNGLEWVTETPLRCFVAVALAFAVWFWS
jgi:hypothetical protein